MNTKILLFSLLVMGVNTLNAESKAADSGRAAYIAEKTACRRIVNMGKDLDSELIELFRQCNIALNILLSGGDGDHVVFDGPKSEICKLDVISSYLDAQFPHEYVQSILADEYEGYSSELQAALLERTKDFCSLRQLLLWRYSNSLRPSKRDRVTDEVRGECLPAVECFYDLIGREESGEDVDADCEAMQERIFPRLNFYTARAATEVMTDEDLEGFRRSETGLSGLLDRYLLFRDEQKKGEVRAKAPRAAATTATAGADPSFLSDASRMLAGGGAGVSSKKTKKKKKGKGGRRRK